MADVEIMLEQYFKTPYVDINRIEDIDNYWNEIYFKTPYVDINPAPFIRIVGKLSYFKTPYVDINQLSNHLKCK